MFVSKAARLAARNFMATRKVLLTLRVWNHLAERDEYYQKKRQPSAAMPWA
jgi:hypothetical protein